MQTDASSAANLPHLLNQLRWITRISVALSSAIHAEDIYSVLVAGMVSPTGLGYSNALLFEYDAATDEVVGKFSVGIASAEEYNTLLEELREETQFLETRRIEMLSRAGDDESAADEHRMLQLSSQWVTLSQRLATESPVTDRVRKLRFPLGPARANEEHPSVFQVARTSGGPRILDVRQGNGTIPSELRELIPNQVAMVPLRTTRGLRSVIFLDRRLFGERITFDDMEALDWFATQGALALQNAELIEDLENTYTELKAVDQLKSNFLSIISHELRTPLTAITGFVELLLNGKAGDVTEAQQNLLKRVAKNTGHLSNMVNDLIEIAEIKAEGMTDVNLVPVDPLNTLFQTLPKLEYRRRGTRVDIEPIFDDVVPFILCDPRVLERIYFHLLDNAVKFSPTEDIVTIQYHKVDGQRLAISICDRGSGIPSDKLQRIFEEFYQVDNSLTRSHEGLGLGLAVTRLLVQATRGEIQVESREGVGSKFTLIYPIAPS